MATRKAEDLVVLVYPNACLSEKSKKIFLGARIRMALRDNQISGSRLADVLGISSAAISQMTMWGIGSTENYQEALGFFGLYAENICRPGYAVSADKRVADAFVNSATNDEKVVERRIFICPYEAELIPQHVALVFDAARVRMGITQEALAERLGCSQSQVSRYLTDTAGMPLSCIVTWCDALDIDLAQLFSRVEV